MDVLRPEHGSKDVRRGGLEEGATVGLRGLHVVFVPHHPVEGALIKRFEDPILIGNVKELADPNDRADHGRIDRERIGEAQVGCSYIDREQSVESVRLALEFPPKVRKRDHKASGQVTAVQGCARLTKVTDRRYLSSYSIRYEFGYFDHREYRDSLIS